MYQRKGRLENPKIQEHLNDQCKSVKFTKITKSPNHPFYFRSAFFHYASDERPKVRAANPNFAVGDIAKELGRRWAEADPSHKSKYEARAEKDRERYIKQKAEFQQVLEDEKNGIVHKDSKDIRKKFIDSDAEEEVEEAEPVEDDEAESE